MKQTAVIRAALLAATALGGVALARPAAAQSAAQMSSIEQQIKALQAELIHMKADSAAQVQAAQDQAKAAQAQAAAAQAEQQAMQAKMAEAAPVLREKLPKGTFRVGGVTVTLGGFSAGEGIYRSKNQAASIDTSFNGGIPFANSPNAHIGEYRFTAQQSRFALLAQGQVDSTSTLTSYMETDFLAGGSSSNNNQSNSYTLRMRQFYGAYDNSALGWHVMAGQGWSLATPYRIGLLPRQENVPLTIDAQYAVGFTWARQGEVRIVKDFDNHRLWAGLSLEEPATIFSGPAGPNCLTGATALSANKVNVLNYTACGGPNVNSVTPYSDSIAPDVIAKLAADPGYGHYEVYGMLRFLNGRTTAAAGGSGANHTVTGEGVGASMVLPVIPRKLEFQLSGLYGAGVGRYGTSQLPDVTFRPDGSITPLTSYQLMGGVVAHPQPNFDLYAYFGTEQAMRKYYTAGGVSSGYGVPMTSLAGCSIEGSGCAASTSGLIEGTIGAWWRVMKGDFGTAQVGGQYEWIQRTAFSGVGATNGSTITPSANVNAFLVSFRYLPFQ